MGTVYAAYQQDPLGDDMQAHDTYAPAPDVNFMSQNPSGMNIYGTLPQFYWGQWSPTEDTSFAESTNMTAPNVFAQEESRYNYPYDPETSTQWDSPATSTHSYPVPSPATDPTSFDIPVGDTESRRSSSSKESDKQKRKRSTTKPTASKLTRRTSTKAIKQETAPKSLRIAEAKPSQPLNLLRQQGLERPIGVHWLYRFIKRHPEIDTKVGKRQEAARFNSLTPMAVNWYFHIRERIWLDQA
jgi:hypothetical protein